MSEQDYLKQRLIEKESEVKTPMLAALLGFFFPVFGYLYVRKYGVALVILIFEIPAILMAALSFGATLLLYHICNSYFCYKKAQDLNTAALRSALG